MYHTYIHTCTHNTHIVENGFVRMLRKMNNEGRAYSYKWNEKKNLCLKSIKSIKQ